MGTQGRARVWGSSVPRVLILGAGASHGHGVKRAQRPPLARGFFEHRRFMELSKHYSPLLRYLADTAGIDLSDTGDSEIEHVFSRVEPSWRLHVYEGDREAAIRFGEEFAWLTPLDMLRSLVVDIVHLSTQWLARKTCPHHDWLASHWLRKGDAVISFNYDLVMDRSLSQTGQWHESTGYGWHVATGLPRGSHDDSNLKLLKVHGSLNWFKSSISRTITRPSPLWDAGPSSMSASTDERRDVMEVVPVEDILSGKTPIVGGAPSWLDFCRTSTARTEIGKQRLVDFMLNRTNLERSMPHTAMPTPLKPLEDLQFGELKEVWKHAREATERSSEVVACGFSFRDQHFNQILADCSSVRKDPIELTLVTKRMADADHVRRVLKKANINIHHYNGWLADFCSRGGQQRRRVSAKRSARAKDSGRSRKGKSRKRRR